MAYFIKNEEKKQKIKNFPKSTGEIWIETFTDIMKVMKKIFKIMMKIGKWIFETMTKISKNIWEMMEKKYGGIK